MHGREAITRVLNRLEVISETSCHYEGLMQPRRHVLYSDQLE